MESREKTDIKVGVFVAFGLAALLISILLLGGNRYLFSNFVVYKTQMKQVQGLSSGSVVALAGMPVGNVSAIYFDSESDLLDLDLKIDDSYIFRITEGSKVSVRTQGALGDKYIYITPGPISNTPLEIGSYLESLDSPDLFDVLSDKAPDLATALDVLKEARKLLSNLNHENRSALLMENLVSSSKNLDKVLDDIRGDDKQKLKAALTHLSNILKKIDGGHGTLGALINDPTIHQKLLKLLGDTPRNKYLKPLIRATIQSQETSN